MVLSTVLTRKTIIFPNLFVMSPIIDSNLRQFSTRSQKKEIFIKHFSHRLLCNMLEMDSTQFYKIFLKLFRDIYKAEAP